MADTEKTTRRQMFAVYEGDELVAVLAKDSEKSRVFDITEDLQRLMTKRVAETEAKKAAAPKV